MNKDITTFQSLLLEFDWVCTKTGWAIPERHVIIALAEMLDANVSNVTENVISGAVVAWDYGRVRR